ncbi:MAG: short-chain dehydrogenase/reductase [Conexibacter sp.]|nr:short-chain dehydrogenase/reductase [Conexibacter sp.]
MDSTHVLRPDPDTDGDARSLASALVERLGAGDAEGIARLFSATVDWLVPGDEKLPWTGRRARRDEIVEYFQTLWSHLEPGASIVSVEQLVIDGAEAIILANFSHVARDTGRRFDTPAALRLTTAGGEIVRLHLYEDTLAVSRAWAAGDGARELDGRRVLLTGGSRGIGAGIAQRLLDAGAHVLTTARSAPSELPERLRYVAGDVRTAVGAQSVADAAIEAMGGVDIIINNAGAARTFPDGSLSIPAEDWQDAIDINFLAAVRLNTALLPQMLDRGDGVIINIASTAAFDVPAPLLHYGAAKAALIAYSKGLATELAPTGVRVNTITPGSVQSPGADKTREDLASAFGIDVDTLNAGIPIGRIGVPEDIAEAVAYLVSGRASYVTGTNLVIDGGQQVRP